MKLQEEFVEGIKDLNAAFYNNEKIMKMLEEHNIDPEEFLQETVFASLGMEQNNDKTVINRYKGKLDCEYYIDPNKPNGTRVIAPHEGIPYAIDNHHKGTKIGRKEIQHAIMHRENTIKWHHDLVKDIYEYCQSLEDIGDIWCLCGGGCQLQVFFGNHKGYLAILYLGMEDEKPKRKKKYTLTVNWEHNNPLFEDFKHDQIKLQKSN